MQCNSGHSPSLQGEAYKTSLGASLATSQTAGVAEGEQKGVSTWVRRGGDYKNNFIFDYRILQT